MRLMEQIITRRPALTAFAVVILLAGVSGLLTAGSEGDPGYLGVSVARMSAAERQELGVEFGVRVVGVAEDSAAAKAGIREEDVVQSFAGKEIHSAEDLQEAVRALESGTTVTIKLLRAKKTLELSAVLGKVSPNLRGFRRPEGRNWFFHSGGVYLGVNLLKLNDDLAPYFAVKKDAGALIIGVEKGSPADAAGIKSGDVITTIAGQVVHDPDDVREAIADAKKGEEIAIIVLRQKVEKTLKAKLDERVARHMEIMGMPRPPQALWDDIGSMPELPDMNGMHIYQWAEGAAGCCKKPEGEMKLSAEKMEQLREMKKEELEKMKLEMEKTRKKVEETRRRAEREVAAAGEIQSI